jgi:hypothetical protein
MTATARARMLTWWHRGDIVLRIVAAIPLGYAVASLWAMALARVLPMSRSEATVTATLIAFVICAVAAMWAFAARTGWQAVWTLTLLGAIPALIAWVSIGSGGRA